MRANQIRYAARKAMIEMDDDEKMRRAVVHRARTARAQELAVGDYVYYWRRYATDGKAGTWRGPARIIGFYDGRSKIWVAYGNKVLRCAPEQLRRLTTDQEAALRFVTEDMVETRRKLAEQGAHVFLDISREDHPPQDEGQGEGQDQRMDESEGKERKRRRAEGTTSEGEVEADLAAEFVNGALETGEIDEPETTVTAAASSRVTTPSGGGDGRGVPDAEMGTSSASGYGPVRHGGRQDRQQEEQPTPLQAALRRSLDMLDIGNTRVSRTPYDRPEGSDQNEHVVQTEDANETLACFMTQQNRKAQAQELRAADIQEHDWEQVVKGKRKEFDKLIKTGALKVIVGEEAERMRKEIPRERILESRFVKTRKVDPDDASKSEIKCRWVLKGFQDPDLMELKRQSLTLSADALSVVLQIIASQRWCMNIMDIEGAFLQGDSLRRKNVKIYAILGRDQFEGIPEGALLELCKCVYGLMDAPRKWWETISKALSELGMKQSELDPCACVHVV